MKKKLILLIVIMLSVFLITGCGKEKEKDNDVKPTTENNEVDNSTKNASSDIDLYSDDTKMVFASGQTKLVYYYSGDTITAYHAYIDYDTVENAKLALSVINNDKDDNIKRAYTDGKYLVIEYDESEYNTMTVSELKLVYSYLEEVKKK